MDYQVMQFNRYDSWEFEYPTPPLEDPGQTKQLEDRFPWPVDKQEWRLLTQLCRFLNRRTYETDLAVALMLLRSCQIAYPHTDLTVMNHRIATIASQDLKSVLSAVDELHFTRLFGQHIITNRFAYLDSEIRDCTELAHARAVLHRCFVRETIRQGPSPAFPSNIGLFAAMKMAIATGLATHGNADTDVASAYWIKWLGAADVFDQSGIDGRHLRAALRLRKMSASLIWNLIIVLLTLWPEKKDKLVGPLDGSDVLVCRDKLDDLELRYARLVQDPAVCNEIVQHVKDVLYSWTGNAILLKLSQDRTSKPVYQESAEIPKDRDLIEFMCVESEQTRLCRLWREAEQNRVANGM